MAVAISGAKWIGNWCKRFDWISKENCSNGPSALIQLEQWFLNSIFLTIGLSIRQNVQLWSFTVNSLVKFNHMRHT